jgi:delta-like protein
MEISAEKVLLLRLAEQKMLAAGQDWSVETHTNNGSKLELHYRVVCDQNYFGDQCSIYCRPQDIDVRGHFGCSASGQKQCIDGWQGENCDKREYILLIWR